MLTLGVIADTHIPDRAKRLHPQVLPAFERAAVDAILHAGDISAPRVLRQLAQVAPVHAVRGNRDWFGFPDLPLARVLTFEGITIGLAHGHYDFPRYLRDRLLIFLRGPQPFRKAINQAIEVLPHHVDVVVFGHNHHPHNKWLDGKLLFNPGSPHVQVLPGIPPTVGLLRIDGDQVDAQILPLEDWGAASLAALRA